MHQRLVRQLHGTGDYVYCWGAGAPGSLWILVQCSQKYIFSGTDSAQSNSSCVDFGSDSVDIRVDPGKVYFSDDYCESLSLNHDLGGGPLYLFIGALCNYNDCPGAPRLLAIGLECVTAPNDCNQTKWRKPCWNPLRPVSQLTQLLGTVSTREEAIDALTCPRIR